MSWLININTVTWVVPPTGTQPVDISYREGGSTGYFTSAGTITFNPDGTINGTPNPFQITGISDAWLSVEVQSVNTCNGVDVLKTFNKP